MMSMIHRHTGLSSTFPARVYRRGRLSGFQREVEDGLSSSHLERCRVIGFCSVHGGVKRPQPDPGSLADRVSDLRGILSPGPPSYLSVMPVGPISKRVGHPEAEAGLKGFSEYGLPETGLLDEMESMRMVGFVSNSKKSGSSLR